MSQLHLLSTGYLEKDIVFTPDWVVDDMVDFFSPEGSILDPCKGDGAFLKKLDNAEWCEIREGKDFFLFDKKVNWIIGNPPYSAFAKWVYHAMELSDNIVYLVPCAKPFYSEKMFRRMSTWGMLKNMRIYGSGNKLNFPIGFLIGAIHFKKGDFGPMFTSTYQLAGMAASSANKQINRTQTAAPVI